MYAFIRSFIEILADLERFKAFRWSSSIDAEMHIFPVSGSKAIKCLSNRASWLAHKSKPLFASMRSSLEDSAHSLIWLARNTDVAEISQRLQWWRSRSNSPVSYTHLDVYKRQMHRNILEKRTCSSPVKRSSGSGRIFRNMRAARWSTERDGSWRLDSLTAMSRCV